MVVLCCLTSEGNLEDKIKTRNGKFFEKEVYFKWIAQLLCGLHHIHVNNIIHRDLKSQNIFIKKGGDLLIGDFGVSKADMIAQTFVGTPYYLCPEMINGSRYTKKADIWSLGVLFYEIVSLRYPFTADSFSLPALGMKIIKGNYPDMPISTDPAVRTMIKSMLTVNPNERPTLSSLMGYSFARNILQEDGTLPKDVPLVSDNGKVSNIKAINLQFCGGENTKEGSTSTNVKHTPARSRSKNHSKKDSSSSSASKKGFPVRVPSIDKSPLNLIIQSKESTERDEKSKTGGKNSPLHNPSGNLLKKPPLHKRISANPAGSSEAREYESSSGQLHALSSSPVKERHFASKEHSRNTDEQKESDLFDLIHHCKKVDMKVGLGPSTSDKKQKGFLGSSNNPFADDHFQSKQNGRENLTKLPSCEMFTEKDLTIQESEVIDHKVSPDKHKQPPNPLSSTTKIVRDKQEIDVASILTVETQNKAQE
jgi:serine/threonine protein kinase